MKLFRIYKCTFIFDLLLTSRWINLLLHKHDISIREITAKLRSPIFNNVHQLWWIKLYKLLVNLFEEQVVVEVSVNGDLSIEE